MFKSKFIATLGAAVTLALLTSGAVHAQTIAPGGDVRAIEDQNSRAHGDRARPGRGTRPKPPATLTAEEIMAAAQVEATAAGSACQVTSATLLGVTP